MRLSGRSTHRITADDQIFDPSSDLHQLRCIDTCDSQGSTASASIRINSHQFASYHGSTGYSQSCCQAAVFLQQVGKRWQTVVRKPPDFADQCPSPRVTLTSGATWRNDSYVEDKSSGCPKGTLLLPILFPLSKSNGRKREAVVLQARIFKGQGEIANSEISRSKSVHFGSSLHME